MADWWNLASKSDPRGQASLSMVMDEFMHGATKLPRENYDDYMVSDK